MSQIKGCPTPEDVGEDPSELQQAVGILLEGDDIPEAVCDQIMALIDKAERDKFSAHGPFTTDDVE